MKWKRTAMSLALAGCMMATTVPVTAFAAQTSVEYAADKGSENLSAISIDKKSVVLAVSDATATSNKKSETVTVWTNSRDAAGDPITIGDVEVTKSGAGQDYVQVTLDEDSSTATEKVYTITSYGGETGKATITFTATNKSGKQITTTCDVEIVEEAAVDAITCEDVALDKEESVNFSDLKLTYTNADGKTPSEEPEITYKSSDSSIVEIDNTNKKLVAKAAGTATITGSYTNLDEKPLSFTFNVKVTDEDAALAFTYSNGVNLKVDEKTQIYATKNNKRVTITKCTSQNTKVATVTDTGLVTAVAPGTTVIDVVDADGNKGTVTITVSSEDTYITGFAFTTPQVAMKQGQGVGSDKTAVYLEATATPAEANDDYEVAVDWDTATVNNALLSDQTDPGLDIDENGKLIANKVGTYTVNAGVTVAKKNADGTTTPVTGYAGDVISAKVVVSATDPADAKTLSISEKTTGSTTLTQDQRYKISDVVTTTVNPTSLKDSVVYTLDSTVAKIDGDYIVALAPGKTTLTATIGNLKSTIPITVNKAENTAQIKAIKLNKTVSALAVDEKETLTVTARVGDSSSYAPLPSQYEAVWTSSNPAVATVSKAGVVTGVKAGSAVITATVGGYSVSCTYTVAAGSVTTGFDDVASTAWYYDDVNTAAEKGLMTGIGDNKFAPAQNLQRSQVAQIVWNMAGNPTPKAEATPFTDVASTAWYAQPVAWAYQNKIVNGTTPTTFEPTASIKREDFVLMLYRQAGTPSVADVDMSKYADASSVDSWATDAVKWAVKNDILRGDEKGNLNPKANITRAEAAAVLVRYTK